MSLFVLIQAGCLIAFASLLLAAGWQDLRSMRIGNRLSLGIVAAFVVWALAGLVTGTMSVPTLGASILCAIVVFGLGATAFAFGALGGGDVKLLAAASLFAGPALLLDLFLVTALSGGALAVALLAGAPIGPAIPVGVGTVRARLRGGLPYGPAIAAGGLWVFTSLIIS